MVIRPITKGDIAFDTFGKTIKGVVVEDDDGMVIGVGGVIHTTPLQCFSEISDKLRSRPKSLIKAVEKIRLILDSYQCDIYASADIKIPASGRFLEYIGFTKEDDSGLYRWQQQSRQ